VLEIGKKIRKWLYFGLDNYRRLEIFYSLLSSMTNPKVRCFHSALHSFMSRNWRSVINAQELIQRTNDLFKVRDLYDKMDPRSLLTSKLTLNQVILDLDALCPVSMSCADIIWNFIERAEVSLQTGTIGDDQIISDLLMILSMSFRHPTFRFHQRLRLGQTAAELVSLRKSFTKPPVCLARFILASGYNVHISCCWLETTSTCSNDSSDLNVEFLHGMNGNVDFIIHKFRWWRNNIQVRRKKKISD
jgi:hypothetical protein